MGAHNIGFKLPKKKFPDVQSLQKWYKEAVEEAIIEYGRDQYNGTISTTRGIKVSMSSFTDEEKADEFILQQTEKWGPVLAVTLTEGENQFWLVGGWAAE